jgi:transposase-like protein
MLALVVGIRQICALTEGDAVMDRDFFEAWLDGIRCLTAEQRSAGFCALALAEAADGEEAASFALPAAAAMPATSGGTTAGAADRQGMGVPTSSPSDTAVIVATTPEAVSLTAAAQHKVDLTGCPHCASRVLHRWGYASGLPRYRCGACRRSFNALTGTPLARLRKKDQWPAQTQALITGESLVKAAKRCDVAVTTAFRWRHRFLSAPALDKPGRLTGIVEADETFILESFKGRRSALPRPARKRGGKATRPGLSAEQIPVLVARDRSGQTTDAVLAKLDRASVTAALAGVVTPANQLCCDGGKAIVSFARKAKIPYCILPKPGGPRPEAPDLHINNVNAYHGRLKEWLRPFHGVATRYLDRYLGWRRTIEALGTDAGRQDWLRSALGIRVSQQLTQA